MNVSKLFDIFFEFHIFLYPIHGYRLELEDLTEQDLPCDKNAVLNE